MVTGLTFGWVGWDASSWNLTNDATGVCLLEGVRGLSMPPVQQYRSESPMVAGSRYRGTRVQQREVFWPLQVWHHGTPGDFVVRDRAFWKTLDPSKVGTWTVTQPAVGEASPVSRTLKLRYESDDGAWDSDPLLLGYNAYGITLVAEQPFWQGTPATTTFTGTDSILVTNPGDVPAWITWTLNGPISSGAHVGVYGAHILVPAAVPDGDTLTIYTQPDLMVALWDDGTELVLDSSPDDYGVMNAKFKAVREGASTHLQVTMSGAGTIDGTLTPYYFRAY